MPLDLPEPDDSRLSGSPLELVVCQIRFESRPVVSDGATALAFHQALGGESGQYPVVEQVEGQAVNVTVGPGQVPKAETTALNGWRMRSEDGAWIVSLMPDHVALETKRYTTWAEDFQPRLGTVIDAAAEHVKPTFEQRLGLRYIDRIRELELTTATEWEPFISREFLGPIAHPALAPAIKAAQQQLLLDVGDGVQCLLRNGPLVDEERGVTDYVLDYDIHRQGSRAFAAESIKAAASEFNRTALQLFQASLTDTLLERLR